MTTVNQLNEGVRTGVAAVNIKNIPESQKCGHQIAFATIKLTGDAGKNKNIMGRQVRYFICKC